MGRHRQNNMAVYFNANLLVEGRGGGLQQTLISENRHHSTSAGGGQISDISSKGILSGRIVT